MNPDAIAKIKMMKASMSCFVLGLLGLLPLVGFPFALIALIDAGKVRRAQKRYWNPARPYWRWGMACAACGTIFWFGVVALLLFNAANHPGGGHSGYYGGGE